MARGVRQGCPGSGFLFAMAFDPIFRWLQEAVIPRNLHNLDFLQPAQCACADDLAVAASCFRNLMTAVALAFQSVDIFAGLNLNYRKCCWVQYGSETRESLCTWIHENCREFRVMQIVKHAKYIGTMIGPEGNLHRWTAPRKKFTQRAMNICASAKSFVERLCDLKIYALSVLSFIGSVCVPDDGTLKAENHALQCTTAGPHNAMPSNLQKLARYRVAACSTTLWQGIEEIRLAREHSSASLFALTPGWPTAPCLHTTLCDGWTAIGNFTMSRTTRIRKLPLEFSGTLHTRRILLDQSRCVLPKSYGRSVASVLLISCLA